MSAGQNPKQVAEKTFIVGCSKGLTGEAREKSILRLAQDRLSGGVLKQYVGARRLSATKHMRLFQQPASLVSVAKLATDREI